MTLLSETKDLIQRTKDLAEKAQEISLPKLADEARARATEIAQSEAAELASELATDALASGAVKPPKLGPKAEPGYNRLIDALNRLPRPLLALTTVGLFLVAAINPTWFEARMAALSAIPEPLWWLAGAVITMFFGSREAYYRRNSKPK